MNQILDAASSRRALLKSALTISGSIAIAGCMPRAARNVVSLPPAPRPVPVADPVPQVAMSTPLPSRPAAPAGVRKELFERAMAALDQHAARITSQDRIAIADFDKPSSEARFHFVDMKTGQVESLLVAHGMGSDPEHTGMLHRFSNDPGSNATCEGAFLTADYYTGKHGLSQRLYGLDTTNNNALDRAIVVHSAWYSNPEMIAQHGKLGRSQGCFAVGERDLARVFERLGPGRMIYASKV